MSVASTLSDPAPSAYAARRRDLLARRDRPGPARRRDLVALTDAWLSSVLADACESAEGRPARVALVAVGGYGRAELAPGSDLDLLLLHSGDEDVTALAERVWYPVWDSGVRLDHSVRTFEEARRLAGKDLAVLLGLLDARLVAGDPGLAGRLRSTVLADWRAAARGRLPELREAWVERGARYGDLRHAVEPDLKEGRGGLRDLVSLRAVAASWVADRPHRAVDDAVRALADVRDALHLVTGRAGNRLVLQEQDQVASVLGLSDSDELLRRVAGAASEVVHAGEVTWRRALQATRAGRSRYVRGRRPVLRLLGPGLAEHDGEAVLTAQADVLTDPLLPLRLAARAARAGLPVSQSSVDRLAADGPPLAEPWPEAARELLLDLLGAGAPLVPVWEALDHAGLVERLLPEWGRVRHLPQRNPVHRFSVDRHLVETAVRAAPLVREVRRPDLLLLAALLHDIGKGGAGDHSETGAPLAAAACTRMGLPPEDVAVVERLVRHHLLLVETATRRDVDDPATTRAVAEAVGGTDVLELLHALTRADGVATGPTAWTDWRAGLVDQLVARTTALLHDREEPAATPPSPPAAAARLARAGEVSVALEPAAAGSWLVTVVAPDRRGLFGAVAGVLALHKLSVRAAQAWTEHGVATDIWTVAAPMGDRPTLEALREDVRRALAGTLDVTARLARRDAERRSTSTVLPAPPRVQVLDRASDTATVVEVRAGDRPGLLHRLGRALALMGVSIRASRVATLGADAVDVFYLTDDEGRPLDASAAREVVLVLTDAAS